MSYYITISDRSLKYEKDISAEINRFLDESESYLSWDYADGFMNLDEIYFKWDENFLRDLFVLKDFGVCCCASPKED